MSHSIPYENFNKKYFGLQIFKMLHRSMPLPYLVFCASRQRLVQILLGSCYGIFYRAAVRQMRCNGSRQRATRTVSVDGVDAARRIIRNLARNGIKQHVD